MSEKMNVLFIITDQQRADSLSCMGNPVLKTPHIDSIAEGGVKFTNYYCNTPICMPNRANFFTGTYPSVHGTRSNGINLNPNRPVISEILRKSGFHTVSVGKTHFHFFSRPTSRKIVSWENIVGWLHGNLKAKDFPSPWYGFNEVYMTAGHGDFMAGHYSEWLEEQGWNQHEYALERPLTLNENYCETELSEELYPSSYITDKTIDYLERYVKEGNNNPFFIHCSYPDPHHPVCPPGKYRDLYKPDDIELPSNFDDVKNLLNHEFLGPHIKDARFRQLLPQIVTRDEAKIFTALTYGSIAMIDDGVGKILAKLKELDLNNDTMVIFTSDHGDYGGDHGFLLKGPAHYRGIINMPLLWRIPGVTETSTSDSLISTVDLPKTILNLLKIHPKFHPRVFQGYDATPILKDPSVKIRDRVLIEHDEEIAKDKIIRLRTLVTEKNRLTIYDGYDNLGDIFNYKSDPDEVNNLWNTDKELRNKLSEELLREIIKVRPRFPKRNAYN
ncbi:MAG: hypothetical protein EU540_05280 [Promethearchaeota archaeon]|nr:MAG: hypothetical protein EU540_05280 [Candidatus Lokiarchaeota archaeon]